MKISLGTLNPAKRQATEASSPPESEISTFDVPSGVSNQPVGDEETLKGAINRARAALEQDPTADVGIGLEGGVMWIGPTLYVNNWGALVTRTGEVLTASGARIPLPEPIVEGLKEGFELGDVMDRYAETKGVRLHQGAIGILTNGAVTRVEMFTHVTKLLFNQLPKK
jgi:inosine/xanthosine triphosphatase